MNSTSQVNIPDFAKRVSVEVILNMPFSEHYNLAYKCNDERGMPWIEMFNTEANTGLTMNYAVYIKEIDEYEAERGGLSGNVDDYDYEAEHDDYIGDNSLDEIDADDGDIDPLLGRRELEYPYTEMNSFGNVRINKRHGRRYIRIWNKKTDNDFTTSYARYLMSVKEGRFLRADEHVDHKDENKTNDDISNLQILTPEENKIKNTMHRDFKCRIDVSIECPTCLKTFIRLFNEDKYAEKMKNEENMYCSRNCFYKSRPAAKMETRICPQCNLKFDKPEWYFRQQEKKGIKNHFCSDSCYREFYKAEIETRMCPKCNHEFDKPVWWFRQREKAGVKNPCCSTSCFHKSRPAEEMEIKICPQCNQEFTKPKSYFRGKEKRGIKNPCCSKSCAREYYHSKKI